MAIFNRYVVLVLIDYSWYFGPSLWGCKFGFCGYNHATDHNKLGHRPLELLWYIHLYGLHPPSKHYKFDSHKTAHLKQPIILDHLIHLIIKIGLMLSIVAFARICPMFLRSVVSPCLTNKQVRSALGNFCSYNWELLFWPYDCFGFDNFSLVTSLTLRCHCKGWLVHSVSIPKYVLFQVGELLTFVQVSIHLFTPLRLFTSRICLCTCWYMFCRVQA